VKAKGEIPSSPTRGRYEVAGEGHSSENTRVDQPAVGSQVKITVSLSVETRRGRGTFDIRKRRRTIR